MILLKNILHQNRRTDILIGDDGRISHIGPATEQLPGTEVVDGTGYAVIPGFINMHTHAAMILLRGIHEDLSLYDWLNNIWKIEARLDRDFIYWGTKAACLEMVKSGTTTFNDQYWFSPHARQAALDVGLRPVVSFIFLDSHNPELARKQREACLRQLQLYSCIDTRINVTAEDQLLLLVTCEGSDDSRRVVAARRLREDETDETVAAVVRNAYKR
jgi:5-methylthioadenosine/S-adenosylhomocysteine deaminase